ncbi:MAG: chorismate-binding protein [Acidobacteriota bacterium]
MKPAVFLRDAESGEWLEFTAREVLETRRLAEVPALLDRLQEAGKRGLWAAGFLSYEAAPAFDSVLETRPASAAGLPLAWWALSPPPIRHAAPPFLPEDPGSAEARSASAEPPWRPLWGPGRHRRAVEEIRERIAAGDTYQVNLTFPLERELAGAEEASARVLFSRLWQAQRAPYAALLETEEWAVCSVSPELFFSQRGDALVSRPMKGTSRRGRFGAEDAARLRELRSEKNRAENLMITDMIRNDLGRVAEPGSVRVEKLFAAESYSTVHQLVSQVAATTRAQPLEVLRALFPCASITGAPKRSTMGIIRELEDHPRGLYTGTVGYAAPGRRAQFSVAIRTLTVDRRRGRARYGVGGGIVWDSRPEAEYDECRAKALVLSSSAAPFSLFETLQWRHRLGYARLDAHLRRLARSAARFGYPFDAEAARALTAERSAAFLRGSESGGERRRIRLSLDSGGVLTLESWPWPRRPGPRAPWRVAIDDRPVDSQDLFLFHKTTRRRVYEQAQARWPEADEVLLWNEAGRLTEGARSSLVLRFGRDFLTPPLEEGLLPGVFREELLRRGRVREARLDVSAAAEADAILLVNSLRGAVRGTLLKREPGLSGGSRSQREARRPGVDVR